MNIPKLAFILFVILLSSCASKKKLNQVKTENADLEKKIAELKSEKDNCDTNFTKLSEEVKSYKDAIAKLQGRTANKIELTENGELVSEQTRTNMRNIFSNLKEKEKSQAKTLEDSINLSIAYNIKSNLMNQIDISEGISYDALEIKVSEPVVSIILTDKIIFNTGSYRVNKKSFKLLSKISDVINSEKNMDIHVEGHADNQKIVEDSYIIDNWDLSIRRSTSVVRTLENKFNVEGKRLIASGRSNYHPIADNSSKEGRALNRRTVIMLIPKVSHFLDLINKPSKGVADQSNDSTGKNIQVIQKQGKEKSTQAQKLDVSEKDSKSEKDTEKMTKFQRKRALYQQKTDSIKNAREIKAEKRKKEIQRKKDSIKKAIKNRGKN